MQLLTQSKCARVGNQSPPRSEESFTAAVASIASRMLTSTLSLLVIDVDLIEAPCHKSVSSTNVYTVLSSPV